MKQSEKWNAVENGTLLKMKRIGRKMKRGGTDLNMKLTQKQTFTLGMKTYRKINTVENGIKRNMKRNKQVNEKAYLPYPNIRVPIPGGLTLTIRRNDPFRDPLNCFPQVTLKPWNCQCS